MSIVDFWQLVSTNLSYVAQKFISGATTATDSAKIQRFYAAKDHILEDEGFSKFNKINRVSVVIPTKEESRILSARFFAAPITTVGHWQSYGA